MVRLKQIQSQVNAFLDSAFEEAASTLGPVQVQVDPGDLQVCELNEPLLPADPPTRSREQGLRRRSWWVAAALTRSLLQAGPGRRATLAEEAWRILCHFGHLRPVTHDHNVDRWNIFCNLLAVSQSWH